MKNRNPSSLANNGDPLIPLLKITKLVMPFPKRRNSWATDIDIPCAAILRWPHLLKGHECQRLQEPPLCQVLAPTSPYPSHPTPWITQILVPTKFIPVSISSSPFRVQRFCKEKQVYQYVYLLPGQKRQWLGRWACRDQCKVPHYGSQRLSSHWANNSAPRKDPRNPMLSSPWRWARPLVESSPSPFSQLWNSCKNLKLFSFARPDLCWRKSRSLLGIL